MEYFHFFFIFLSVCGLFNGTTSRLYNYEREIFSCRNGENCESIIMGSICDWRYCSCNIKSDTILSSDATECLPIVEIFGSLCEDNVQCSNLLSTGGICIENRCECKDGYHYFNGFCRANQDLEIDLEENDSETFRINFWNTYEREQYRRKLICINDFECQNYIIGSKCIDEECKCKSDELLSSDATKCLTKVKDFGSPCEDNVQCSDLLASGGICDKYYCSCKNGYHYLNGSCWKNIGLNEECVKNEQCFSSYEYVGLECVSNGTNIEKKVCKCRQNYYERLNSACRRKRYAGDSCNLDDDCEHNPCVNMKCQRSNFKLNTHAAEHGGGLLDIWRNRTHDHLSCPGGMYESNGNCVRELGTSCISDSECDHIENALCLDKLFCACKPVLFVANEDNRACLKVARAKIDDISKTSCKKNPQCGVFGPHSICENQRCTCKNGTYFEVETKFCWVIKSLQESCTENRDCWPAQTHAHCALTRFSGKKCLCQNGYHQKGLECVPNALKVGDPCESHEECLFPNSVCNASNICECKEYYYFENGKCIPGVGSSCSDDKNCTHLQNTECKIGNTGVKQCLCIENQIHSKDNKYCLPVADHKEICQESFQCEFRLGPYGICKNEICECLKAAHYSNGKCHKSKFVGETCSKRLDCFPGNDTNSVICLKGFCSCNYGYELEKNEICIKTNSATTGKFCSMSLIFLVLILAVK